jgi:sterol desaturase/sphingolipid hydroxylase (fatty acid hydroxylase superfamily)/rhodanese-related sulfurtransferase
MNTQTKNTPGLRIARDASISLLLYALPVLCMFLYFYLTGYRPWEAPVAKPALSFLGPVFRNLETWGLPAIMVAVGFAEFFLGLYDKRWGRNERILDIVCFVVPKIIIRPAVVFFALKLLPLVLPGWKNAFSWVSFGWGCFIIAIADDLTQYWYHRLHHQLPFLWRFHRTHHSAPYMGMAMASRQNIIYTIFFSQIYLTAALTYLGLGYAALFVTGLKSMITLAAHSSIPWDRPLYRRKWLHPVAWVLERLISTPATHHAHHADRADDGVGNYKGNFGNMFFFWDVLFGTGIITRQYPAGYGIRHYKQEEWYAQFLWPIFKSRKEGSELALGGPVVGDLATKDTRAGFGQEEPPRQFEKATGDPGSKERFRSLSSLGVLMFLSITLWGQNELPPGPLTVDSFAAKIGRQADPHIIDVRTPEEFAINHLHGAISIDLRVAGHLQDLKKFNRADPVFIYAIQNKRSGILADELRKAGYSEVYELKSGIASWIGAGYPYYTSTGGTMSLADYERTVAGKGPVLVDIGTRYCGLCRQVKGMIDSLKQEKGPSYTILEIELYNNPQLVAALKEISAVPTVLLYEDGKIVWKRTGLVFTKSDIEDEVAKIGK